MMPTYFLSFALILSLVLPVSSKDLNYTIQGQSGDKAPLETFSPSPDIPSADSILFSLDGGKSAREDEVFPLTPQDAALLADSSHFPAPVLPLIPEAPFITHSIPLGDKHDLRINQDTFSKDREEELGLTNWEFTVKDETNKVLHSRQGEGAPPRPITWNGFTDGRFAIDPNRTINSYLVIKSSNNVIGSWPGEGTRFMCAGYWIDKDFTIQFSKRLYEKAGHLFTPEGRIYLSDVARRFFYHAKQPKKKEEYPVDWVLTLYEPNRGSESSREDARKEMWISYLEDVLNEEVDPEKIIIQKIDEEEPWSELTLINHRPVDLPNMQGTPVPPRVHLESTKGWVSLKRTDKDLVVELRHDRVFMPGSAYLRDEALPQLASALTQVGEEKPDKRVIIRSYKEKVHDTKRNKREEDPRLAALRSKVLIMLFSRERLLH